VAAFKAALIAGAEAAESTTLVSPPSKVAPQVESTPAESPEFRSAPPASRSSPAVIPVAPQPSPSQPVVRPESEAHKRGKSRRRVWVVASVGVILLLALIGVGGAFLWGGYFPRFGFQLPVEPIDRPPESVPGGHISLLHAYEPGSPEESALMQTLDAARRKFPNLEVDVQSKPGDEIFRAYPELAAQGAGPDLLLAPNDHLWVWAQDGIVVRLNEFMNGKLEGFFDWSLEGMTGPDGIYGLPNQAKVMALYFNHSRIDRPPDNQDELMAMVHGGATLTSVLHPYFLFGWGAAFGGSFFDDQGRCIANQTGWLDALIYLHELRMAGALFDPDYAAMETPFINGETAMFINGPWALQLYREHLGDMLGVAPMPRGPAGPARPLTGIDGYYVNPDSGNIEAAVNLALFLTSQEAAQLYVDHAQSIPVRRDVEIGDPLLAVFLEAAKGGVSRAQSPELDKSWIPFQDAFAATIMEGVPPEESLGHACALLNERP